MRTFVIGDIHGGLHALKQVIERASIDFDQDKVIFLGDYVDGWSQSAELIEFLIGIKIAAKVKPIFLRGNHDKWCQEWLINGHINKAWQENGGRSTMTSYINTGHLVKESHRNFFLELLDYYVDEENRAYLHAGWITVKGLGYDRESTYYWDREFWKIAFHIDAAITNGLSKEYYYKGELARYKQYKEVFIGHSSTQFYECDADFKEFTHPKQEGHTRVMIPMNRLNVWNVDTGGGWHGKLTALNIDTKEFFLPE